jgi:hypothetical protein
MQPEEKKETFDLFNDLEETEPPPAEAMQEYAFLTPLIIWTCSSHDKAFPSYPYFI